MLVGGDRQSGGGKEPMGAVIGMGVWNWRELWSLKC